jgi:hypothetical protein
MEAGDSMDEDDLNISEYLRERKKYKSVETRKGVAIQLQVKVLLIL